MADLINIPQGARILGISEDKLRRLIRRGILPVYDFGPRSARIDPSQVRALVCQVQWRRRLLGIREALMEKANSEFDRELSAALDGLQVVSDYLEQHALDDRGKMKCACSKSEK
jgi:excisionase family DNA binding protein